MDSSCIRGRRIGGIRNTLMPPMLDMGIIEKATTKFWKFPNSVATSASISTDGWQENRLLRSVHGLDMIST